MGFASRGVTAAEIQAAILDDATKFSGGDITTIDGKLDTAALKRRFSMLDFWSTAQPAMVTLTTSATDYALQDVVIPDLGTFTLVKAYAMLSFSEVQNMNAGGNSTNTDTFIQVDKSAAGYINAISMPDNVLKLSADEILATSWIMVGDLDISSRVTNNSTVNFKWANAVVAASTVRMWNIRTGVRLLVRE